MKKHLFFVLAALTVLLLNVQNVKAAGFQLIEQSVSGLGNAFAGGAAIAEDATTIFYNPAGLTRVPSQFIAGVHFISPSAKFHDEGSSRVNPLIGSLGTNNGGDGGVNALVPNIYYSRKIGDKAAFGIGVNVPFGLGTEYPSDWIGRYHAIKSDMKTININPTFAFNLTNNFSLGVGVSAQYIKADLSNAVDQKLILASSGAPLAVWSAATDAYGSMEGDGWGYGYTFWPRISFKSSAFIRRGYKFFKCSRIVSYKSESYKPFYHCRCRFT